MDRNSSKKIKRTAAAAILVLVCMLLPFAVYLHVRGVQRDRENALLFLEYPKMGEDWLRIREKEDSLSQSPKNIREEAERIREKYGYTFWKIRENREILLVLAAEAGIAVLFWGIFVNRRRKEKKEEEQRQKQAAEQISELLQQAAWRERKGEKPQEPREEVSKADQYLPQIWDSIQEGIRQVRISFERMEEQMEKEEADTKAFITNMSHQLKTPLAGLNLCLEMLEEEGISQEEQKEFTHRAKEETENLQRLLDALVNVSRLEEHMIVLRQEPRDLKATVIESVNVVLAKALEKKIEISAQITSCMVSHDFRWTQEALVNVLDNAVKYSECGKTVEIRMKKLTSYVLLEILDQGMGIEAKERHKVFQRFYRGQRAKELQRDGAGVGLYLSRQILEQQGGTISVRGRADGPGSCFQITLPLFR